MLTICVGMGYTLMRELSDRIIEAPDTEQVLNDHRTGRDMSSKPETQHFNEVYDDLEDRADEMEPRIDFVRRVTHVRELKSKDLGNDDWVTQARRRKLRMARRMLLCGHGASCVWTEVADSALRLYMGPRHQV